MTDEEIIDELNNGAILVYFIPDQGDEQPEYQLQMGDISRGILGTTFQRLRKKGVLEYSGIEKDNKNNLIYTLKEKNATTQQS